MGARAAVATLEPPPERPLLASAPGAVGRRVESVGRVGQVLDLFDESNVDRGIGEAAALLGLSKGTTHALFATLVDIGLLDRTPDSRYRLGWGLLVLSRRLVRSFEYWEPVVNGMRSFVAKWGDTMHLGVLERGKVVYVHKAEGVHKAGVPTQTGVRLPAHGSAVGKMLLAHLPPPKLNELVLRDPLPRLTTTTITDERQLRDELAQAFLQGFATDREETIEGISCVAVPIKGPEGHVVAAMSVCARSERFERFWPSYVRAVRATAEAASTRLKESQRQTA